MENHGRTIASTEIAGTDVEYIENDPTIRERFENEWDETELLRAIARLGANTDDATFWDVGACVGVHTMLAAQYFDTVEAFEPVQINAASIFENVAVNTLHDTISVQTKALSKASGEGTMAIRGGDAAGYGRHSLKTGSHFDVLQEQPVDMIRGDGHAANNGIPTVVKIDVEGAEGAVLDGMSGILDSDECQHVFVETHAPNPEQPSYEDFGYTLGEIHEMLLGAGFSIEHCGKEYLIHARKV